MKHLHVKHKQYLQQSSKKVNYFQHNTETSFDIKQRSRYKKVEQNARSTKWRVAASHP